MLRKIAGERWKQLTCEERKPYYEALGNRIRAPRRKRARDLPDSTSLQELVDSFLTWIFPLFPFSLLMQNSRCE